MIFFRAHKILSIFLVIMLLIVIHAVFALIGNLTAEKSLKSQAPITAHKAISSFDGQEVSQSEKPFSCYDASREFSPSDRYCAISYNVEITPSEDIEQNHTSYRKFYDALVADKWDVGTRTSTNTWRDTFTRIPNGDSLQANDHGAMNITGKKDLGRGARCNLTSQYAPPQPHDTTEGGTFNYDIDCFYQVIKPLGL